MAKVRGGSIAYIFQEPGSSLNPVYTIGFQIGEAISLHRPEIKDVRAEVIRALTEVHINDPARVADQYPHELSGGMQQRAMIAMALACDPKILVADEPTGDLDSRSGEEILVLLERLHSEFGKTIVMVTHDPKAAARAQALRRRESRATVTVAVTVRITVMRPGSRPA